MGEEIPIHCEIPITPEEKAQGLMYRDTLGKNNGMYYDNIDNGFWMKDVKIPLEMIFIEDDEISEIITALPEDTTNIQPSLPANANLEVNEGFLLEIITLVWVDKIYRS